MWQDGAAWLPYGVALSLVSLSFIFLYWCDSSEGWLWCLVAWVWCMLPCRPAAT